MIETNEKNCVLMHSVIFDKSLPPHQQAMLKGMGSRAGYTDTSGYLSSGKSLATTYCKAYKKRLEQLLPENPIRVWYDTTLVWCDGSQLSVLRAENGAKYLSIWVDETKGDENLIYLCVPVSDEELKEYETEEYNIHAVYDQASRFYTNEYKDFDGDTYLLRPINRENIPKEWWPGK